MTAKIELPDTDDIRQRYADGETPLRGRSEAERRK